MGPFNFFPVSTYLILILSDTHDPLEIVLQPLNKFSFTLSCLCLSLAWQMVNSFLFSSSFMANTLPTSTSDTYTKQHFHFVFLLSRNVLNTISFLLQIVPASVALHRLVHHNVLHHVTTLHSPEDGTDLLCFIHKK